MKTLPIKYAILEGIDLSGKSSLYSSLNKTLGFSYNIRDRSYLSTLSYARLYNRLETIETAREGLTSELLNLNNFVVILMPPLPEILRRFHVRGDDFQNEDSLVRLYEIFLEETNRIRNYPNVLVIDEALSLEDLTKRVVNKFEDYEMSSPPKIGGTLQRIVKSLPGHEGQISVRINLPVDYSDLDVLDIPHEQEYYASILNDLKNIIQKEFNGENEYGKQQDLSSRRFYYSSNTCISSIHVLPREGNVKVICSLRSTDVIKNGEIDLRFLSHLSASVVNHFKMPSNRIILDIHFNSAHIRTDTIV